MNKITINLINSGLAGALVLLGSCTDGFPSVEGIFTAFIASFIVALTQFKDFWKKELVKPRKQKVIKLFNFTNL